MKHKLIALALAACVSTSLASSAFPLEFPKYGFAIDALDASPAPTGATQALMMCLPAKAGFAPNVNVQIQPFSDTAKKYAVLSRGQFAKMKMKVVSEKAPTEKEWTVEYSGELPQGHLHWYARAIVKSGKVYLVTATDKEETWSSNADALKKCVDSFSAK